MAWKNGKGRIIGTPRTHKKRIHPPSVTQRVMELRREGKTYDEIREATGLSNWQVGEIVLGQMALMTPDEREFFEDISRKRSHGNVQVMIEQKRKTKEFRVPSILARSWGIPT